MDHVHYFQIPQQPREGLRMEQVSKATRIPFNRKATQEPSLTTKSWKGKHVNCSMHKHGASQQKHSNHHSYTPTCAKLNTTERTTPCIAKAMQANGNIKWRLFDIARHENSRDKIISGTGIFQGQIVRDNKISRTKYFGQQNLMNNRQPVSQLIQHQL